MSAGATRRMYFTCAYSVYPGHYRASLLRRLGNGRIGLSCKGGRCLKAEPAHNSPKKIIERCNSQVEILGGRRVHLLLWCRKALNRGGGTCKSKHQSAGDDGNPAARIFVDRKVATPSASLLNAFAAEQRNFSFTVAHIGSPLFSDLHHEIDQHKSEVRCDKSQDRGRQSSMPALHHRPDDRD
jgi:hypothetical protein